MAEDCSLPRREFSFVYVLMPGVPRFPADLGFILYESYERELCWVARISAGLVEETNRLLAAEYQTTEYVLRPGDVVRSVNGRQTVVGIVGMLKGCVGPIYMDILRPDSLNMEPLEIRPGKLLMLQRPAELFPASFHALRLAAVGASVSAAASVSANFLGSGVVMVVVQDYSAALEPEMNYLSVVRGDEVVVVEDTYYVSGVDGGLFSDYVYGWRRDHKLVAGWLPCAVIGWGGVCVVGEVDFVRPRDSILVASSSGSYATVDDGASVRAGEAAAGAKFVEGGRVMCVVQDYSAAWELQTNYLSVVCGDEVEVLRHTSSMGASGSCFREYVYGWRRGHKNVSGWLPSAVIKQRDAGDES